LVLEIFVTDFHKVHMLLHFAWVIDDVKCMLVTRICVSVCPSPRAHTTAQTRMQLGGMVWGAL